jgi:hypothetical protein
VELLKVEQRPNLQIGYAGNRDRCLLGEVSGHRGNRRPARGVLESFTVAHADRVKRWTSQGMVDKLDAK